MLHFLGNMFTMFCQALTSSFYPLPSLSRLACGDRQCARSSCRLPPEAAASRQYERSAGARRRPRRCHLPAGAAAGCRKLQIPPFPLPPLRRHRGRASPQSQRLRSLRSLHTVRTVTTVFKNFRFIQTLLKSNLLSSSFSNQESHFRYV